MDSSHGKLVQWFEEVGGRIGVEEETRQPLWRLHDYSESGMGVGVIATTSIQAGTLLFEMDKSCVLSTRYHPLCQKIRDLETAEGEASTAPRWETLAPKWVSLMLIMLYERMRFHNPSHAPGMTWGPYLEAMPMSFDTPMFWEESELKMLSGTTIEDKIGKEEAELDYDELVLPMIKARPSLFLPQNDTASDRAEAIEEYYSRRWFHIMGSRVLSRSFDVPKGSVDSGEDEEEEEEDAMEISAEQKDEEAGTVNSISMVPMADMLNALPQAHNARLEFLEDKLEMRATADLQQGDQIFNTYANPPNHDLLRRYGYVDLSEPDPEAEGGDLDVGVNHLVELDWKHLIEGVLALKGVQTDSAHYQESFDQLQNRVDQYTELDLIPEDGIEMGHIPKKLADASKWPGSTAHREAAYAFLEDPQGQEHGQETCSLEELWPVCRLLWVEEEKYQEYLAREKSFAAVQHSVLKDASRTEADSVVAVKVLKEAILARMKRYNLRETACNSREWHQVDEVAYEQLLSDPSATTAAARRAKAAYVVRIGEKRLLSRLHSICEGSLALYESRRREQAARKPTTPETSNKRRR